MVNQPLPPTVVHRERVEEEFAVCCADGTLHTASRSFRSDAEAKARQIDANLGKWAASHCHGGGHYVVVRKRITTAWEPVALVADP